ncbi:MAG: Na+/H+ antiporter NhaA [Sphingobacteriales bacterium 17-39-43]|uniref:Na+/H+ antiporter NhaA n=1 Tax=Daejeonella sp. TaxID=2805397 RepID=UPI000BD29A31|nr:Na+/H+ antiporter NhaA [Daejeonella sp.]OYZ28874.1 MAG: Na+/H+ antiporter NhaA [Sphingobacteriales bacterium 16-39-50]OZA22266.1 MAG: Na+/H+ antiporter NhaA [Sphingobacteriales bacterium 17-39-43]OZA56701.1 MAG: Na+/H+ antiporter NhaA [Sphingobacteriales bacterium 39-40-5]HQS52436.1 Na+/H+ antiporter NhaA [Daejeonella sp.]HQT22481.1 Na+/H+ antiporter NhaA [Daejeonella sp.]
MAQAINLKPFRDFFRSEQIGGIILIFSVFVSLSIANSAVGVGFENLLDVKLGYSSSSLDLEYSLSQWINDGLMAIFFLLIGLEIKREIIEGELSSPRKASMPIFAAIGGMFLPAGIYFIFNSNLETTSGWGIPMATDIAFALGILSLLGKRVPASLKVFLAALAIVDDLGAILVIAIFYTNELHWLQLLYSAGILALLIGMNYWGVKRLFFYIIPGLFLWYFIHHSGIHATIAGVLLALTIPSNPVKKTSPLEHLEHLIVRPVNFLIMPIFALANTNIRFENKMLDGLTSPLGLGIIFGLVIGKPLGVTLFSWIAVKSGLATLPSRASWKHIFGLGLLAGIGFTMSIFIALLSFSNPDHKIEAKFSILLASILAGVSGFIFLLSLNKKRKRRIRKARISSQRKIA